jgi:hypothetical protein
MLPGVVAELRRSRNLSRWRAGGTGRGARATPCDVPIDSVPARGNTPVVYSLRRTSSPLLSLILPMTPPSSSAHVALRTAGQRDAAREQLRKAVTAEPRWAEAWLELAHAEDAAGHPAEALEAYDAFVARPAALGRRGSPGEDAHRGAAPERRRLTESSQTVHLPKRTTQPGLPGCFVSVPHSGRPSTFSAAA